MSFFFFFKRLFFCTKYIRIPFVSHSLLSVIFRLIFFNGRHLLINCVSILKKRIVSAIWIVINEYVIPIYIFRFCVKFLNIFYSIHTLKYVFILFSSFGIYLKYMYVKHCEMIRYVVIQHARFNTVSSNIGYYII